MSVQCKEIQYGVYGRCLEMSNELCRLVVTLDKGPHIICYQLHGEPNVMHEDREDATTQKGPDFDNYFYPGAVWHIYGGHRLWLSPESMPETYYPDNFAVPYTVEGGNYPDGGCSFETYTCKNFLEMESLGELATVAPGESVDHVEHWELRTVEEGFDPRDEYSVNNFAKKYIW